MRLRLTALVLLFFADRLIKNSVWFMPHENVSAAFFIHPMLNDNIAFSLSLPGISGALLTGVLILIVCRFVYLTLRTWRSCSSHAFWWGLVTIGALSNILDRLTLSGVLDYFDFGFFPVFNLSDVYISIGIIVLLAKEFRESRQKKVSG